MSRFEEIMFSGKGRRAQEDYIFGVFCSKEDGSGGKKGIGGGKGKFPANRRPGSCWNRPTSLKTGCVATT